MISTSELKARPLYLDKLIAFRDTEPVKVITGIRRCGKSSLMKLMMEHLRSTGTEESQIIYMNFESYAFASFSSDDFYAYVRSRIKHGLRMYLFFDEVQRIARWENAVNAFRVDFDCDIYITGSNSYLLSSEYSTYLAGRCVEIKMLPLSFAEFISFNGLEVIDEKDAFGQCRKKAKDGKGIEYNMGEVFQQYMRYGGMPGVSGVGLDQEKAIMILDGIYSSVVVRDILERENRKGQKQVSDPVLLRKIIMFLSGNIGSSVSLSSIGNVLKDEGLIEDRKIPSAHTVQSYANALTESFLFYEIKRFDLKGRDYLRTNGKYYIADLGLRNYLLGYRDRDRGHSIENIVYLELLRRDYDPAIGKIGNSEIDFVAEKSGERIYIQVCESLQSEDVAKRELSPLRMVNDSYDKIVLSLDRPASSSYDGIKPINLISWLLN